jgi:putative FmdB family regulatory protein
MPTYEYACEKCKHRFERLQSIREPAVKRCPVCRGRVRRLISGGAGLLFKGSGFYCTDYRKGSGGAKRKDSGGESCPKDSSSKGDSGGAKSSSADKD